MRVLQVISQTSGAQAVDGITAAAAALATGLRQLGVEVTSAVVQRGSASHTISAGRERLFRALPGSRFQISPQFAWAIDGLVRTHDVVHVHALWRFPGTLAGLTARARGVPYVLSVHGMLNEEALRFRARSKRLAWRAIERHTLSGAARVHFTTEAERADASAWAPADRAAVVPFGVDLEKCRERSALDFRQRYAVAEDAFVAGFLGRIHPIKGLDLLVAALAPASAVVPSLVLAVAGPDEAGHRAALEAQAVRLGVADRIKWLGPLHGTDKCALFGAIDVFVLPSRSENFGLAAVEAMAAGRAVIITAGVNIAADVAAAGAGWVTPGSADALAGALVDAWRNPAERQARAHAACALARDRYDIAGAARSMLNVYVDCVAVASRRRGGTAS